MAMQKNITVTSKRLYFSLPAFYCLLLGVSGLLLSAYFLLPAVVYAQPKQLTETIKKAVLAELVRSVSKDVELNGIRILKGLETLDNNKTYTVTKLAMDDYNGPDKIVYLVSICDDHKVVSTLLVGVSYDILDSVYVAARPLPGGAIVAKGDIYAVKQKSSRLPPGAITDIQEIEGKKLRFNVAEGMIFRSGYFGDPPGIKRTREVNVLVEGANIVISTKGILNNDPPVGGVASVLCSASRKEISGTLISHDTVRVKI